jgi:hypothetical protein
MLVKRRNFKLYRSLLLMNNLVVEEACEAARSESTLRTQTDGSLEGDLT